MPAGPRSAPRKDAQRNRQAILEAARHLFAESGDVPMYEIARRAGVGQATLYRHFPDRRAVAQAIFAEQLDDLERLVSQHAGDPTAFVTLLEGVVAVQARFLGLIECIGDDPHADPDTAGLKDRFVELMKPALRDAKSAGLVRPDLTVEDVFLLIAMVSGALDNRSDASEAVGARALALIVEGLGPRVSAGPAA